MDILDSYFSYVKDIVNKTVKTQKENINKAADLVIESCLNGGRFYVFGSGHSHMIAEELYIRAGGLALVKAILPSELMLHEMANKSTFIERLDGYSEAMLKLYKVDSNDTLMIISNSGRNSVPVEMAIAAKEKNVKTIALTSLTHSKNSTSRHKSGKRLFEVCDVCIDNGSPVGDAGFYIDKLDTPIGATSDLIGILCAQAIIVKVVDELMKRGFNPPVFKSSNVDNADSYNQELFDKYYGYWK